MAGYLGAIPVPQATQHRESFTATSGQTTFNTAGYTVGFLDVYLNGSHLSPADFTATNGSDVVLASGASTGDVCDIISYTAFEVNAQTFTGGLDVTGGITADGLTVDGNGSFSGTDTYLAFIETDLTNQSTRLRQTGGSLYIQKANNSGGFVQNMAQFATNGDISFYEDTGNTAKLFWDASAESLGIGTSSPSALLHLESDGPSIKLVDNNNNPDYEIKNGNGSFRIIDTTAATDRLNIDSTGAVTMPAQPAFQVKPASDQSNIPIGASTTVVFGTEIFDQNADFASNTFTAPVTGKYQLNLNISFQQLDTDMAYINVKLITSNRDYTATMGPDTLAADGYGNTMLSLLCDMDASDTVFARLDTPASGAAQTDVIAANTSFSGYLVA